MIVKSFIIAGWFSASYVAMLILGASWPALLISAMSVGFALAGLGMAVQHDGGHRAFSENRKINRAAAAVLDMLGGSSYIWRTKHGVVHHTYPNVEGADDDIEAGAFARFAPGQPHRPWHRFQQFYMWLLYGLLTIKWVFVQDFRTLASGQVGNSKIRRPEGLEMVLFVAGKIGHFSWALLVPLLVLGWAKGLVFYLIVSFVAGVTLGVTFQLAHCVEEADFVDPVDGMELDFFVHQLATTVDFARDSRICTWYMGGLNYQAVHHLFPRVCHLHYPALSKIVETTAAEYGVRYRATPTLLQALGSHYRWLRRMGSGEVRVPASTAAAAS